MTRPADRVMEWIAQQPPRSLYTTEVNIAEIRAGISVLNEKKQSTLLADWLESRVRPWFSNRVLSTTEDVLELWLRVGKEVQRNHGPTPPADLLIAAIAMHSRMIAVTRDVAPFVAAGAKTLNPFTGERFNGA